MGIYLVQIKITVFWKVMPWNLADRYQRLGGVCCLHLQGRRAIQLNVFLCMLKNEASDNTNKLVPIYQIT